MCGRYTLRTPAPEVARHFNLSAQVEWQLPLRYNIAPTQQIPVVRQTAAGRELTEVRWGLIPSWAKDAKIGASLINARSETVAEKPAFRSAIKRRRCLIPADGFFEWIKVGKQKQPVYCHRRDDGLFAFAGLWERWGEVESCTILTGEPNALMRQYHDRMPVILGAEDFAAWLDPQNDDPGSLTYLYEPYPAEELAAYLCNPAVNSARHDAPDCLEAAS